MTVSSADFEIKVIFAICHFVVLVYCRRWCNGMANGTQAANKIILPFPLHLGFVIALSPLFMLRFNCIVYFISLHSPLFSFFIRCFHTFYSSSSIRSPCYCFADVTLCLFSLIAKGAPFLLFTVSSAFPPFIVCSALFTLPLLSALTDNNCALCNCCCKVQHRKTVIKAINLTFRSIWSFHSFHHFISHFHLLVNHCFR